MILDWCLAHFRELDRQLTREGLDRNRMMLRSSPPKLKVDAAAVQAVLASSLCSALADRVGSRALSDGREVPVVEAIAAPTPGEYARLISKGRLLYEHCMAEVSHVCLVGFMHHELTKSESAQRVVWDLLGWMVEQRFVLVDLVPEEGDGALARIAETDYVLDVGVSYLHGVDRAAAQELAVDKEP